MSGLVAAAMYTATGAGLATAQMGVWWFTERTWPIRLYVYLLLLWVGGMLGFLLLQWFVLFPVMGAR